MNPRARRRRKLARKLRRLLSSIGFDVSTPAQLGRKPIAYSPADWG